VEGTENMEKENEDKVITSKKLQLLEWLHSVIKLIKSILDLYRRKIIIVGVTSILAGIGYIFLAYAVKDVANKEEMDIVGRIAILIGGGLISISSDFLSKVYWLALGCAGSVALFFIASLLYYAGTYQDVPWFIVTLVLLLMITGLSCCCFVLESAWRLACDILKEKGKIKKRIVKFILWLASFIGAVATLLSSIQNVIH